MRAASRGCCEHRRDLASDEFHDPWTGAFMAGLTRRREACLVG
jgi:hypothetical protein